MTQEQAAAAPAVRSGGGPTARNGTRERTRRAILDAAVTTLAATPTASLADVAAAAGVGRTTVHRYFPERADLLDAIGAHVLEQIGDATDRARVGEGPAMAALERLCQEYFEVSRGLTLIFENPQLMSWEGWEEETDADRALLDLIQRGREEGAFDPELPDEWVQQTMWSLLYAAWAHVRENGASKHTALSLCLRTLRKALAA
ncbi:TetR/AcrR family transcriptional regulator [Actinomadura hibisca]|uniref:TetR/AcrR family transcriptional regulator n=1 Tax=Actinomadura hibisca TaxID=68565 RepID=UPI000A0348CB|nr:TetR family transcriptional regulator [Actinomadura hibisca]